MIEELRKSRKLMALCGGFLVFAGVLAVVVRRQDGIAFLLIGTALLLQLFNKPTSGLNAFDLISFVLMANGIIFLIATYFFGLRVFAH